jgi:hypothetical protein
MTVLAGSSIGLGADSSWSLRFGPTYRDLDAVEFGEASFRNLGNQNNPAGPYGVQNATTVGAVPAGTPVALDYVQWPGATEHVDQSDHWGPGIGIGLRGPEVSLLRLGLAANVQAYAVRVSKSGAGSMVAPGPFSATQYRHLVLIGGALSPQVAQIAPAAGGTQFAVCDTFDMDLIVLDLGLEAQTAWRQLSFTLAAGPTLNLADCESVQRSTVWWAAQAGGSLPAGLYAARNHDSELNVIPGLYGSVGIMWAISARLALGAELRYDTAVSEAETDSAGIDLDGASVQARMTCRF